MISDTNGIKLIYVTHTFSFCAECVAIQKLPSWYCHPFSVAENYFPGERPRSPHR